MRILIVDDGNDIGMALAEAAGEAGYSPVTMTSGGNAALQEFKSGTFDVVLLDLELSRENGTDLLDEMLRIHQRTAVIMLAAHSSMETAVGAIRRGAFDYLPKPCPAGQLRHVLERVEKNRKLENRLAELESRMDYDAPETDLITKSPTLEQTLEVAFKAAASDATILLLGESGTGKSVLARAIHQRSPRAEGAFITVSCPGLSHEPLEARLFGHVKGAFAGADAGAPGKVAAADGGTLFFDEIGDLPLKMQSRLLRLLQDHEYERVGDHKSYYSDARVIAATNRNLLEAISAGKFREDLYYRLNVISVTLPPLRERIDDIDYLIGIYLKFFSIRCGKKIKTLSPAALEQVKHYHWPGNLRELRNVIEHAVILSSGDRIEPDDFTETIGPQSGIHLGGGVTLETIKNEHIRRVVKSTRTLKQAADILGVDTTTIYRHGIKAV
jgi:NtrC-family two-component system response regulator AlgB